MRRQPTPQTKTLPIDQLNNLSLSDEASPASTSISSIPTELLSLVFSFVPSVGASRQVSRSWKVSAENEMFGRLCEAQQIEIRDLLRNENAILSKLNNNVKVIEAFKLLKAPLIGRGNLTSLDERNKNIDLINEEIILNQRNNSSNYMETFFRTFNCSNCFLTRFPRRTIQKIDILNNINVLDLSNNCLHVLPDGLGNLPLIMFIHANNNLLEQLPNSITGSKKLIELRINQNCFKTLPDELTDKVLGNTKSEVLKTQKSLEELSPHQSENSEYKMNR